MKKLVLTSIVLLLFGCLVSSQTIPPDSLYFGQTPPGNTPQVFAPGIVSLPGRNEANITFSPDGETMFFYIEKYPETGNPYIMYSTYTSNHWTTPDTIPFSVGRACAEPIFDVNSNRLYMNATNTVNQQGIRDLCYSVKQGNTWGIPISMGNPPNSESHQFHPCLVADSSVYFSSNAGNVCRSQYSNGSYESRVILPKPVNFIGSPTWGDPYVAPDESYMLIKAIRPEGYGQNDIYIAYKKNDGTWTNPKNLGNIINTPFDETTGDITSDGLYMTYGSNKDLYWVSTGFIDSLKYTNYIPYVKNLIPTQTVYVNHFFSYTIPDSTFVDDDGNNTLTYEAAMANGNPLPSWLAFGSITGRFSGTPPGVETLNTIVTAIDTAGKSASTPCKIIVQLADGINQTMEQGVNIFPNPSTGQVNISLQPFSSKPAIVEISNLTGKMILTQPFKDETSIDLSAVAKGIYIIKVTVDQAILVKKVCIVK